MAMELNQPKRSEEKAQAMRDTSDLGVELSRAVEQAIAAEPGSDVERAFLLLSVEKATKLIKITGTLELKA